MRKKLLTFGFFFATLATAGTPADVHLATIAPKGTSFEQILMVMREKWRNSPGGGIKLTIHPGGVMGGEATVVQRMRVGTLQAAMLSVVGLSAIDESVTALQYMPMMFRSLDELEYVSDKLRPALEKRLNEKGFAVLFWADAGWIRFFSKKPAIHPADFKPMKMFVWAGDSRQSDIMKAMGYQPRSLETSDILPNLQTGMIDAVAQPPFFALAGQLYSFAPNMLSINWAPAVGATVVKKETWEQIPAETRTSLLKAAKEAGDQIKTKSRLEAEQSVESMKKRGLIVHTANAELETEWRSFAEDLYPKIRGTIVPAERFDEVSRLLRAYRASGGKVK